MVVMNMVMKFLMKLRLVRIPRIIHAEMVAADGWIEAEEKLAA